KVPSPTFCDECRMIRRMTYRNERALYQKKCAAAGKDLVAIYTPESSIRVYDYEHWWSDGWSAMDFGRDYDFGRSFFSQFKDLMYEVPWPPVFNSQAENSDYCNQTAEMKNCYLVFASREDENVMYGNNLIRCRDCMDLFECNDLEYCNSCINCNQGYNLNFCHKTINCSDSAFLYDCANCHNCFGCTNLRNKSFRIWNKQYTKEEYEQEIKKYNLGSYQKTTEYYQRYRQEYLKSLHKYAHIVKSENCTGDDIYDSKNCLNCFNLKMGENDKNIIWGLLGLKDSQDCYAIGVNGELCYENLASVSNHHVIASMVIFNCSNISYSMNCHGCNDLFGCVGLRKKEYCIFNKQYSKEEYEKLVPKIIEHMNEMPYIDSKTREYRYGEFFPSELSPFAYNETIAQEHFALTKEKAGANGYQWKNFEEKTYQPTTGWQDLVDDIKQADDKVTDELILCRYWDNNNEEAANHGCTKVYKILPQELVFYQKYNLPLPRFCPNCRYFLRLKKKNEYKLFERNCQCHGHKSFNDLYINAGIHFHADNKCPNNFWTPYNPQKPEIVYCEECYVGEVV
ncbi:hypothetical protein KJ855_01075, partial [Patescibacteria group bacterium]|nr:hypothetical protein [Patescibacteria group bacterium]